MLQAACESQERSIKGACCQLLVKVKSLASSACCKLLVKFKSVASRACCQLFVKAKRVASKSCCKLLLRVKIFASKSVATSDPIKKQVNSTLLAPPTPNSDMLTGEASRQKRKGVFPPLSKTLLIQAQQSHYNLPWRLWWLWNSTLAVITFN
jgi:hypothetical protein